tara:strand:- start:795 stop:944 length:150 start_codon:yes stop_codon:yes gene_type:complete
MKELIKINNEWIKKEDWLRVLIIRGSLRERITKRTECHNKREGAEQWKN